MRDKFDSKITMDRYFGQIIESRERNEEQIRRPEASKLNYSDKRLKRTQVKNCIIHESFTNEPCCKYKLYVKFAENHSPHAVRGYFVQLKS